MTVSADRSSRKDYVAAEGQTTFPYDFQVYASTDLQVYLNDVLITTYTVSGVGDAAGGNVVLAAGASAGDTVAIRCNMPLSQGVDYVELDAFPAETHERALDKLTIIAQQQQEELGRALKFPAYSGSSGGIVPDPVLNQSLRWSSVSPPTLQNYTIEEDPAGLALPLTQANGGTGQDTSAATGVARLDDGTWSFSDTFDTATVGYDTWVRSVDSAGTGYIGLVKTLGVGGVVVVGAGEGTDGTLWLASDDLNSGDSSNGDVIIGYNKHFRSVDSDNDFTRKLIGCETIGAQPDVVVIGDNATAFAVGSPATVTNAPGGSLTFANDRGVRAATAAGDDTISLVTLDSSDRVQLGTQGSNVSWYPAIPIMETAKLPAAGASMDGCFLIEDAGTGNQNLIIYADGQRFRIDGGTAF